MNQSYFIHILESGMLIDQIMQQTLKKFNLTHAQYNVLRILNGSFPVALCMKEIKQKMIIPTSDLTRLVDRLENKALVIRGECPDNRRKINIMITPKGQELLIEAWPEIKTRLQNFMPEDISEEESKKAIASLEKIKTRLKDIIYAQH